MLIQKAYAHLNGESEVVVDGHDHAVENAEQAHPAVLAFAVLPGLVLMIAIVGAIVWTAFYLAAKKAHENAIS